MTSIGTETFIGETGLLSIDLPAGLKSIGGRAFCNCSGLTSIDIPESVTSIGSGAFLYLLFLKISQCLFSQEHIEYYLYFLIKSAPVIPVFQPPASYTIIAVLMLFSDTNMRCTEKVE